MCERFASMCVKCTAFVQYLHKPEEGVGVPGTAGLLTHAIINNRVWMYFWHSDFIFSGGYVVELSLFGYYEHCCLEIMAAFL